MKHAAHRSPVNAAGRLESHPIDIVSSRLHCAALPLNADDPAQPRCELVHDEDSLPTFADQEAFRLERQFTRAHGVPTGEFTTLSTTATSG